MLLYGDVDLNIMDGSAIWLQSLCHVLNMDPNIETNVLLKARIKNKVILSEIEGLLQIRIIDTYSAFHDMKVQNQDRINTVEAVEIIQLLHNRHNYDCILVRGYKLVKEMLKTHLMPIVIPYITDIPQDKQSLTDEEIVALQNMYRLSQNMFVQTEEMKSRLITLLNVDGNKFQLMPPMIPDYEKQPNFKNDNNKLVYTGKFDAGWCTEEIIQAYKKLRKKDNFIGFNIAGDKFQGELAKKRNSIIETMSQDNGINWVGAISRSQSIDFIQNSDVGVSWRTHQIDNDQSMEISTKLLEYGSLGKPTLMRRTIIHENLFGRDYYLFVDNEEEFVEKAYEIFNNPQLYYKTAKTIYEACKKYTFSSTYLRLKPILWSYSSEKIKIVFAGHDFTFIQTGVDYFASNPKYEVRIDRWSGHHKHNEDHSRDCLEWADVIFCEWGLGNAVWYSNHKLSGQKLIVRMHLQERETSFPSEYKIDNIDTFIAISPYIFEEFHRVCKIPRSKMKMIYNLVDTARFNKQKYAEQDIRFNLGICGILPARKRFDRALAILEQLWTKDKRYKLYVKSKMPQQLDWLMKREDERKYYEQIFNKLRHAPWNNNVVFDEYGNDVDEWFRKIGYILSTSDFESFHVAPMEGMASGSIPLVLNWTGAGTIYPEKFIFKNESEIVNYVLNSNQRHMDANEIKGYPYKYFDKAKIIAEFEKEMLR
jgi:glycosyltransferase involved in cell wall biosynthesis